MMADQVIGQPKKKRENGQTWILFLLIEAENRRRIGSRYELINRSTR